jgi:hypothetical protein
VSPLGTLLLPQPRVYQKEPCCLPSLPTTHYPPTTFLRVSYSLAPIREGYELLSPPARRTLGGQPLCFDIHPHCPGVWGLSSLTLCFSAAACPDLANASPFVSCSYGLFVTPKNVKSFAIKQIQTLFAKHPGWGYLCNLGAPCSGLFATQRNTGAAWNTGEALISPFRMNTCESG